ncbi:hypothetical protein FF041_29640 [Streptomyces jumonjinensis]|uniref:Uncharacterized protein n=1 Tax=Streptomyces jumonjinensis TaxID=1945 RepID=A0A646KQ26_STRJU|nr:hypothetical protein [Streptomyces jumonjinensis]
MRWTGWLSRHRVLLPRVSVVARQVAEKRLHVTVAKAARRAGAALPGDLVATLTTLTTLTTPESKPYSELERLRRPPPRTAGTAWRPGPSHSANGCTAGPTAADCIRCESGRAGPSTGLRFHGVGRLRYRHGSGRQGLVATRAKG